jgi:hypothetical protein
MLAPSESARASGRLDLRLLRLRFALMRLERPRYQRGRRRRDRVQVLCLTHLIPAVPDAIDQRFNKDADMLGDVESDLSEQLHGRRSALT